jgi:hypothetical protein
MDTKIPSVLFDFETEEVLRSSWGSALEIEAANDIYRGQKSSKRWVYEKSLNSEFIATMKSLVCKSSSSNN